MAKILTASERETVAEALDQYAGGLESASDTGNPTVDQLVARRARSARELATQANAAHRVSFSVDEE